MARSWQYPRWRRVVVQVVLWGVLAASLGVAELVVRHKALVGSVQLGGPRSVDLPGGVRLTVRLPKGWPVDRDAAEHTGGDDAGDPAGGDPVPAFEAHESAGGEEGDAQAGSDGAARTLVVFCQPVAAGVGSAEVLRRGGVRAVDDVDDATWGGPLPMARVQGSWAAFTAGQPPHPAYAAAAVVPAGPDTPTPLAVTLRLDCAPGDPAGDRDLLRRVAAAVSVDRDRAAAAVPVTRPTGDRSVGR